MQKINKRLTGGFMIFGLLLIAAIFMFFFAARIVHCDTTPVLFFEGSVNGLSVGSQVYFRGVPVGKVEKIQLLPNNEDKIIIPVYIKFDPKAMPAQTNFSTKEYIQDLITHGLKGKLKTQSMLTGQMIIELDFYPNYPDNRIGHKYDIEAPEIPTMPSILDELSHTFKKIPLDKISNNTDVLLQNLNNDLPELVHQSTLAAHSINKFTTEITEPLLQTIHELNKMIRDVSDAANSVSQLSDYLERHPDALLKGKGGY